MVRLFAALRVGSGSSERKRKPLSRFWRRENNKRYYIKNRLFCSNAHYE